MVRERVPDSPAGETPGPVWISAANGSRRARIGIETQLYQRGCAPSCPVFQTGRRPPVSAEPGCSGARRSKAIIAGPRNNRNRHGASKPAPVAPAVQLGQVVAAHQPDKVDIRETPSQCAQRIDRVNGAQLAFDRGWHDRGTTRHAQGRSEPRRKRSHARPGLQGIAGRDQPPDRIEPKRVARKQADPPMPAMGRIEAATQQPNAWFPAVQGRTCPVPRTSHL